MADARSPSDVPVWSPFELGGQSACTLVSDQGCAYRVTLATPDGPPPPEGYPAVLVLDGAGHFQLVAGAVAALARRPAKTGVSPIAVIGLSSVEDSGLDSARRIFDFTDGPPQPPATSAQPGGGAEAFLKLISEKVLPAVAAAAPIDVSRLGLFGHSLGALFGLYVMTQRPDLFRAWLLISPSLWWRPDLAARAAETIQHHPAKVYIAWGEREGAIGDPEGRAVGPRAVQALARLRETLPAGAVAGGELADEDHGSTPFVACPAALRLAARAFEPR